MITFLFGISMGEIILVFLVVLLLFGANKIPEFARMLGKGMNEFRKAADDIRNEFNENASDLKEDLHEAREYISEQGKEMKEDIKRAGEDVKESFNKSAEDVKETIKEEKEELKGTIDQSSKDIYGLDDEGKRDENGNVADDEIVLGPLTDNETSTDDLVGQKPSNSEDEARSGADEKDAGEDDEIDDEKSK